MDTEDQQPTSKKPAKKRGGGKAPPPGPLTNQERAARLRFAKDTFRDCLDEEEQLCAIEEYCNVERKQAKRYLEQAREALQQITTDYETRAKTDATRFLISVRNSRMVKWVDRLAAQKQLSSIYGIDAAKELKVSGVGPSIMVATQVNLLASTKAIEAALMLEQALAQSSMIEETQEKVIGEAVGDGQ